MATAEPTSGPAAAPPTPMVSSSAPPVSSVLPGEWTFADLLSSLGGIPPERIRMVPAPGTATEDDVLEADAHADRLCELIDGTLVEKTVGYKESLIAVKIIHLIMTFLETHDLGIVLGEAGTLKILPRQVRIPDVCFISWDRFPNRQLPAAPIPALAPDLAIEILSKSNTDAEMQRKLHDYFTAGVRLVWYIDPGARSAKSYTAENQCVELAESQSLSGGDMLPGFEIAAAGSVREGRSVRGTPLAVAAERWFRTNKKPAGVNRKARFSRMLRLLAIIWAAAPYTLVGLTFGFLGVCTGGHARIRGRAVEFYGGIVTWLVKRLPSGQFTLAVTLGHTVLGQSDASLDVAHDHEMIHVRQYERWGPLMGPMYLLSRVGSLARRCPSITSRQSLQEAGGVSRNRPSGGSTKAVAIHRR